MTSSLVPCAVCGAQDFELIYRGSVDPNQDPAPYFSSSRVAVTYWDIVRCKACQLVMENPRDDERTLERVYGQLSDAAYDDEVLNRRSAAADFCRIVQAERKPPARLLDVGCATGFFVESAAGAGYDVVGADPAAWSIERAKARCPKATFVVGSSESLNFQPEFDIITLWDVLEHVHSPREVLQRVSGWLKPGGSLLMSMPNAASFTARALGSRWVLLLREHLWYFAPDTIVRLLDQCGFELVRTETKWVSFTLAHVTRRLAQYTRPESPLRAWSSAAMLKRASIRFPMGEMNVVARKR